MPGVFTVSSGTRGSVEASVPGRLALSSNPGPVRFPQRKKRERKYGSHNRERNLQIHVFT
jgi:hypothetical protein